MTEQISKLLASVGLNPVWASVLALLAGGLIWLLKRHFTCPWRIPNSRDLPHFAILLCRPHAHLTADSSIFTETLASRLLRIGIAIRRL